jgi:choline kinase
MKVILLAAGRGTRLGNKNYTPKSLFRYKNKTILEKLIAQLIKNKINNITLVVGYKSREIIQSITKYKKKIKIITNKFFTKDTNIYSAFLGIGSYADNVLILETDCVYDDKSFKKIIKNKSTTWFTLGKFKKNQIGGILKKNKNKVVDLKIVKKFEIKFKNYLKLTGALYISKKEITIFKKFLKNYLKKSMKYYYLQPIIDNLESFNCYSKNLNFKTCFSFNTLKEFQRYSGNKLHNIEFVRVDKLKHIENFSAKRVINLKKKIIKDKYWKLPIKIDEKLNLVMDGQHRMEVAKLLGFKYVPCLKFDYKKIKIWSLRPKTHTVSVKKIFKNYERNKIYPYKTVKHFFPKELDLKCKVKLDDLKNMR